MTKPALSSVQFIGTTVRRIRRMGGASSLEVERDGGVIRRQVLQDEGWNDVR
ncbi:MAG: hypothetical protein ACO1OB_10290 [Archangium sp.]